MPPSLARSSSVHTTLLKNPQIPGNHGGLALRPYQIEAVQAIEAAAARGQCRQLLVLPTGTGKTVIFASLLNRRPGRAVVLAHRDELIQQAVEKLQLWMSNAAIGIVKAQQNDLLFPVLVASVQTLARANRLAQLPSGIDTLVIDEAHHAPAPTYRGVIEHLAPALLIGVTATPDRGDRIGLGDVFETIVFERSLAEMIDAGWLCDLAAKRIRLAADLDAVHTRAGDLDAAELAEALTLARAPDVAAQAYVTHASGRPALVFTASVALAHDTAAAFLARGVRAAAIDGGMPLEARRAILADLHTGALDVVANCAVLNEGFDEPRLSCIVLARPTKSRALFAQMIGRGTRTYPGKTDCLILDVTGNTHRHDLVTVGSLVGVENDRLEAGETVASARSEAGRARAAAHVHGQLVAEAVDLFTRHRLQWASDGRNLFVLSLGTAGSVRLVTNDHQRWTVIRVEADRSKAVLARDLNLGYAQGVAEDLVREHRAWALNDPAAAWRQHPPTEKQLAALRKFRIPITATLTKGEAKDLLDIAIARCS